MVDVDDVKKQLFKYGFSSDESIRHMEQKKRSELLKSSEIKEHLKSVELDKVELANDTYQYTPYPKSLTYFRLVHESPNQSLEESYFWVLEHLRQDRGFHEVIKITDTYASSEASAMWGNQQQRISAQQNQAQQLLANIGKFVKELFQMIRELRILDERLDAYEHWKESNSADVTLKSIFTDQVEGGTKNPQSVFGLSQTVGFTILPDLFFNTHIYDVKKLDTIIDDMTYNTSVKTVLRRKLYQFITWKERTHEELKNRRKFNIAYLKQHWGIIETYMQWAKPYLRNIQRIQMNQDAQQDPELITSFDTNLSEIEILAKQPAHKKGVHPVLVINFQFRTRPEMAVRKEYQQGPAHMGRVQIDFRSYAWTQEEIASYQKMREQETVELIGLLDKSLEETMDSLKEDFEMYLFGQENQQETPTQNTQEARKRASSQSSMFEPFLAVGKGFAEIGSMLNPISLSKKKSKTPSLDRKSAEGAAQLQLFLMWHIYKKAHRMISW